MSRSVKDHLDQCFLPLGFRADAALAGHDYSAEQDDRVIRVHCSRRVRTRYAGDVRYRTYAGHRLEITVTTPVKTRLALAVVNTRLMRLVSRSNRFFQTRPVKMAGYDHLDIWAFEPDWAKAFLDRDDIRAAFRCLIPPDQLPPNVGVKLWPGYWTFSLRAPVDYITPERAAAWVDALKALDTEARRHPPSREAQKVWLERQSPLMMIMLLAGVLMVVPMLLILVVLVAAMSMSM